MPNRIIAVVAFHGISPFHLSIPCMVFGEDRTAGGVPRFDVRVCAAEAGPLSTSAGITINTGYGLEQLKRADTIIVPSWRDPEETPPARLLEALRKARQRGACLVGLCLGSFVLAAAGVLDGRPATTHWLATETFARRYPGVRLNREVLYVDDGKVLTSAGAAAGIDCCLHLLRTWCGAKVAGYVARRMVVPLHRQGGQAQYIEHPLPVPAQGERLSGVLDWAQRNVHRPLGLDVLASRARMSRRTFTRQFRKVTGTTTGRWLLNQRLALAQQLLETTDRRIDVIAERAGFGSAVSLRQHFRATFGIAPSTYRRGFRGH
ncbi:MAG: GlxA family transcriptional regulator [Acidiferrobacterales bacterium]